jgi:hypothetical protein
MQRATYPQLLHHPQGHDPDVLSAVGQEHGFDDPRCGFIAFLSHAIDGTNVPYIEIETRRGDVGYRTVPASKLDGIAATRRLLECFDVRFLDVPRAYDNVIGPAIERLPIRCLIRAAVPIRFRAFGSDPSNKEHLRGVPQPLPECGRSLRRRRAAWQAAGEAVSSRTPRLARGTVSADLMRQPVVFVGQVEQVGAQFRARFVFRHFTELRGLLAIVRCPLRGLQD